MKNSQSMKVTALAGLLAVLGAAQAAADNYPSRPIRLVVPSTPTGGTNASARIIAPRLSERLGQQIVVENRPGAATMIGLELVARAAPDGYTLLVENSTMAILPSMRKNPRLDLIYNLAPITLVSSNPQLLVSHPSLPTKDLKQLIAFARANPGKLDFAAGGYGGNPHMCMELLLHMTRTKMTYVPYKSGNAGLVDVVAGQVPVMMAAMLTGLPHVRSGRLRVYGVTTAKRAAAAADIPTIAEAGVPGYDATQWFGILAPKGTPADIVNRLHAEIVGTVQEPAVSKQFSRDGSEAVWSRSPADFAAFIKADEDKWARVVKTAGLEPR